ncbi:MAG: DUF11 domain-containing protein [Chloroflexi bacterium]|nr:DUF11 domain-containing protein [Chloroflexota bacterium]MCI0577425.1 DUF11 domain-containing protein [Chloroflexota bacterium]MCI0649481.1 DUF11 domain-containing protein [Chloroflexota bacterium]MCI0725357.1 DUF11 domain-containing protein [Chloroflexota bacterium]
MKVKRIITVILMACLWLGRSTDGLPQPRQPADGTTAPELIAAALARQEIDRETAALYLAYALFAYDRLPAAYRSDAPWSGTRPLQQLRQELPDLQAGPARSEIESLLAGDCGGWNGLISSVPEHLISNSTHFHIQYAPIGGGLTIKDYVWALETAWSVQVDTFGWAGPPVLTANPPPGNRYHVRVEPLGGGLLGFTTNSGVHAGLVGNNPATPWNEGDAQASCIVLNWVMPGSSPLATLQTTAARELNQAIQYGYGVLTGANVPDPIFTEGGATWMEDEVFDGANLNSSLLWPTFSQCMGQYAATPPAAYWITWRGLTEQYITGVSGGAEQVMEDFWENMSQSATSQMLPALNAALANRGTNLPDAFQAYAIAARFMKTCNANNNYPYCFREAANYVAMAGVPANHGSIAGVGSSYNSTLADNYALNWVGLPPGGGPYDVRLANHSNGGILRGSVVCDTGSGLAITPLPDVVMSGETVRLNNYNPAGCVNVVAVLTNQTETAANPAGCAGRSYELRVDPPAPDLAASFMQVNPRMAAVSEVVTFTAQLVNNGSLPAAVSFSDTLPASLQIVGTPMASSGNPPVVNGQTVTWSGAVNNGNVVVITIAASVAAGGTIVNTAQVDDGDGNVYTLMAIVNGYDALLPLVARD